MAQHQNLHATVDAVSQPRADEDTPDSNGTSFELDRESSQEEVESRLAEDRGTTTLTEPNASEVTEAVNSRLNEATSQAQQTGSERLAALVEHLSATSLDENDPENLDFSIDVVEHALLRVRTGASLGVVEANELTDDQSEEFRAESSSPGTTTVEVFCPCGDWEGASALAEELEKRLGKYADFATFWGYHRTYKWKTGHPTAIEDQELPANVFHGQMVVIMQYKPGCGPNDMPGFVNLCGEDHILHFEGRGERCEKCKSRARFRHRTYDCNDMPCDYCSKRGHELWACSRRAEDRINRELALPSA